MGGNKKDYEEKEITTYLQRIIGDYLSNRKITWIGKDGRKHYRRVERGVPQGSVLGPLLWNIAYDGVLRMSTPADCEIICYADDTLVIAGGKGMEEAVDRAEIVVNMIPRKIRWMRLQIAAEKSEAVRFRRKGEKRNKENKGIVIESTRISMGIV